MLSTTSRSSATFAVDDVMPATERLRSCTPLEAARALIDAPPGPFAADESTQGNPTHGKIEATWSYARNCVADVGFHPLLAAAHLAFSEHRPLVFSPDVVWITIAQGLAEHIRLDREAHRAQLVSHAGKRSLVVERNDLHRESPENPWSEIVAHFTAQLHQEIGPLAERFVCDFSTTGPVERMVSQIVLLDTLRPYFNYYVVAVCGIPSVTLEGTADDWWKLRAKVELLAPFGLDWWLDELRPICDQFVRAATGDVDLKHWQGLYKLRHAYGMTVINGWLGKLFPYLAGSYPCRNPLFDSAVKAEIRKLEAEEADKSRPMRYERRWSAPGVRVEDLPRGLSQVRFTYSDDKGNRAMDMLAGAMAVTQDTETGALRPQLGWAIREAAPIEQVITRMAVHDPEPSKTQQTWESLQEVDRYYIPRDILRFYERFEAVSIGVYHILPFSQIREPEWTKHWENKREGIEQRSQRRIAKLDDDTEILIRLFSCEEGKHTGAVFVGRGKDSVPASDSGIKIARSFSDFLLRSLDSPDQPYFRRPGFVPLD